MLGGGGEAGIASSVCWVGDKGPVSICSGLVTERRGTGGGLWSPSPLEGLGECSPSTSLSLCVIGVIVGIEWDRLFTGIAGGA